jgi:hypothetical protein
VGSAVGYFFGSLIGYGINNSGGTGNAFSSPGGQLGGIIGGSACGLAGAIYGWSAPQRFLSDDEILEKVIKGNYMKDDGAAQDTDQKSIFVVPTPDIRPYH